MTNILLATAAPATGTKTAPRSGGQSSAGFEAAMSKVLTASNTPTAAQSAIASATPAADSTLAVAASVVAPDTELLSGQPLPAGQPLVGHAVPMNEGSVEQDAPVAADDMPAEAAPVPAGPSAAEAVPAAPATGTAPARLADSLAFEPNPSAERLTSENAAEPEAAAASGAHAGKDSAIGHAPSAGPVLPAALSASPAAPNPASTDGPATITADPAPTTSPATSPATNLTTSPANASAAAPVPPSRPRTETPILGRGVVGAESAPASPSGAAAQPVARTVPAGEPSLPAGGAEFDAATRVATATTERDLPTTAQSANPSQAAQPIAIPSVPASAPATAVAAPTAPPPAAPSVPFTAQIAGPVFSLSSAAPGEHVLTINVAPDNLGPVTVRAHVSGDGIRVELFAPNDAGRDALRAIMPELRRDLSGSGMNLELSSGDHPTDDDGPVRERAGQDQRGRDERERMRDSGHGQGSQRADDQAGRGNRDAASTLDVLV